MSDDITPEQMKEILESEQLDINDFLDPRPLPFLAKLLRNYGISSNRTSSVRGYKRSDFNDAWSRYIPLEAVIPVIPVTLNDAYDAYDAYDANLEVIQQTNQNLSQINQ